MTYTEARLASQKYEQRHGSFIDRGSADSYYGRPQHPHHRIDGDEVVVTDAESVQEYLAGYAWNEQYGDKKDWG